MNLLTFGLVICQWQDHREQGKATIGILLGHLPMDRSNVSMEEGEDTYGSFPLERDKSND